jgi:hypothetical protein
MSALIPSVSTSTTQRDARFTPGRAISAEPLLRGLILALDFYDELFTSPSSMSRSYQAFVIARNSSGYYDFAAVGFSISRHVRIRALFIEDDDMEITPL